MSCISTINGCFFHFLGLFFNFVEEVGIGCCPKTTLSYVVFTPASILTEELMVLVAIYSSKLKLLISP